MTATPPTNFDQLGLKPELNAALAELGYEEPTPIQSQAIPAMLEGRDVLAQAATGTGKTAAFALPLLHRLGTSKAGPFEARILVVVPTRELAMQVAEAMKRYGQRLGVSVLAVYGGQEMSRQIGPLKRGVDVVVATPGRALDHIRRKTLKLGSVEAVVLDEADEMLDLGFAEDLETILNELPEKRQAALFSATLPSRIAALAENHLKNPVRVKIAQEVAAPGTLPRIQQRAIMVPPNFKELALVRLLDLEAPKSAILFCATRIDVEHLAMMLTTRGYNVAGLHGGLSQEQRDRVLRRFKKQELSLLIATDVAARGLDVEHVTHVFNVHLPSSPESYVHRIGRTGRAGREGTAISLVTPREQFFLKRLGQLTKQPLSIEDAPSAEAVHQKRLALMQSRVEEALNLPRLTAYESLVDRLIEKTDARKLGCALASIVFESMHPPREDDDTDIPSFRAGKPKKTHETRSAEKRVPSPRRSAERLPAPRRSASRDDGAPVRRASAPRHEAEPRDRSPRADFERKPKFAEKQWVQVVIGLGREAGIRPQDIVGALANEAGIDKRKVGEIHIDERSTRVGVDEGIVGDVTKAFGEMKLRGRRVTVLRSGAGVSASADRPERFEKSERPKEFKERFAKSDRKERPPARFERKEAVSRGEKPPRVERFNRRDGEVRSAQVMRAAPRSTSSDGSKPPHAKAGGKTFKASDRSTRSPKKW